MKYFLFFPFLIFLKVSYSENYIIEFQAKVKNLIEYDISKTEKI